MDIYFAEIIGAFISIIFGVSLTTTISSYAQTIIDDNNSSEILITLAPFLPVVWLVATFGIAFALMYKFFKG